MKCSALKEFNLSLKRFCPESIKTNVIKLREGHEKRQSRLNRSSFIVAGLSCKIHFPLHCLEEYVSLHCQVIIQLYSKQMVDALH